MKKTILPLFLILSLLAFSASAQVKQVFKVVSYPEGKPLAGATLTLDGNVLKTNAKGVAVATLPESRRGDYLPMEDWILDGYFDIGSPKSGVGYFQGNDTIFRYMVKESDYREAQTERFTKYFQRAYNGEAEQMLSYADSAKLHPDNADEYAQLLMDYGTHIFTTTIRRYYRDAIRTSPYVLSRMREEVSKAAEPFLQEGDVKGAVAAVKALVKANDISRENLETIDNYLAFKDLNLASDDGEPSSDYSRILYENDFTEFSIGEHLFNLLYEGNWMEADSISAKEKAKDRVPQYSFLFEPSALKYADGQSELFAAAIQRYIDKCKEVCSKYYFSQPYWMLIEQRRMMLSALRQCEDTLRVNQQWDSLLVDCQRYFDMETKGDFYRNKSIIDVYLNILESVPEGLSDYSDTKIRELAAAVLRASKENHNRYPSDLYFQLQYAVLNNAYIQLIEDDGKDSLIRELTNNQLEINEILLKAYPEMMSVNQLVAYSKILAKAVYGQGTDEEVQSAFRNFKRSFTLLDSIYHGVFTSTTLDYCAYAANYLRDQNRTANVAEMDAFIELLMVMHADENNRPIESEKALFFNHQAETYYHNRSYDISLQMYDSATDYFMKAVEMDPKQWIPFMRNYLQKGDAYLELAEYGKARETYRKVLEYEAQIPSDLMAEYYNIKGNVFYYDGDVYNLFKDKKNADKMYKLAEQNFKRAVALGDSTAYFSLGEMYMLQAVHNYKKGGDKKLVSMLEKAARTYESYPMNYPYQRYQQAVSFLEGYYRDRQDSVRFVRELKALTEFYHRFASTDTAYLNNYIDYSHRLATGLGVAEEEVKYAEYEVDGYRMTFRLGKNRDISYLQALYRLANKYSEIRAYEKTFDLYEECLRLNEWLYKDTASADYARNAYHVYSAMIDNYAELAEKSEEDEVRNKWYEKAVYVSDTMILVADQYMEMASEEYKNYVLAAMYHQNALICNELDWRSIAITQLDRANEYLLKMYGGELWSLVESDVMRNLYLKGKIASDNHDVELAKECYQEVVEYASKSDELYEVEKGSARRYNSAATYYYEAVLALLDILENREDGKDVATIESLKKQRDALIKILKGKK